MAAQLGFPWAPRERPAKAREILAQVPEGLARTPKARRALTADERRMIRELRFVTFPVASPDKRFVRELMAIEATAGPGAITEAQAVYLVRVRYRYRRQMPRSPAHPPVCGWA